MLSKIYGSDESLFCVRPRFSVEEGHTCSLPFSFENNTTRPDNHVQHSHIAGLPAVIDTWSGFEMA